MQLGRPALIVPAAAGKVGLERVLIGWKDTRESRRAALDALPLLKKADHVAVCEIASEEGMAAAHARLEDVVSWLKRDGIAAEPVAALSTADDATRLNAVASDQAADVIVAGAYGHSRLREWALGGVTKDSAAGGQVLFRVALTVKLLQDGERRHPHPLLPHSKRSREISDSGHLNELIRFAR